MVDTNLSLHEGFIDTFFSMSKSDSAKVCNSPPYQETMNLSLYRENFMSKRDGLLRSCCNMSFRSRCGPASSPTCR